MFLIPVMLGGSATTIAIPLYPPLLPLLMRAVPWLLVAALLGRSAFAAGAFRLAYRQHLLTAATMIGIVMGWFLVVGVVSFVVFAIVPAQARRFFIIVPATAILVPLARFPASVLALEWNRHR